MRKEVKPMERQTEVRVIGNEGEVVAVVKLVNEEEEVVKEILLRLSEVGDLEIWRNGLFVGLIESEN
jgi:hypothetical protein